MAPIDHRLDPEAQHYAAAKERKQARLGRAAAVRKAEQELQHAEQEALLARQAFGKLEARAVAVRELGGTMPADFWTAFGMAVETLRCTERAAAEKREALRKCS